MKQKMTTETKMKAIYICERTCEDLPTEDQLIACRNWLRKAYPAISFDQDVVVYSDKGQGDAMKQPQFKRMMKDVRDGKIEAVVIPRLNMLQCSAKDFTEQIMELMEYDVTFCAVDECFETSTPMGRAMYYMLAVFHRVFK